MVLWAESMAQRRLCPFSEPKEIIQQQNRGLLWGPNLLLDGNKTLLCLGVFCVFSLMFSSTALSSFLSREKHLMVGLWWKRNQGSRTLFHWSCGLGDRGDLNSCHLSSKLRLLSNMSRSDSVFCGFKQHHDHLCEAIPDKHLEKQ